jgi:tetratricopeptide (TPR) repeat protein
MGRYEEAETLLQEALVLCRTALGGEHPQFAAGLNNLAELYRATGRYKEAEPIL